MGRGGGPGHPRRSHERAAEAGFFYPTPSAIPTTCTTRSRPPWRPCSATSCTPYWTGRASNTCFITCYIVALSTTAESVQKLTLRILGCAAGAIAGIATIVYVMPGLTSVGALLAVVFIGAFVSAWVAAGSARVGYAGFQIAFAFFLCVIQGPSLLRST